MTETEGRETRMAGDAETDVLVVGAGPAGATAALALASNGVRVVCINKHGSCSPTPRAHITNQRTMEILRDLGVEDLAIAAATPQHLMRDQVFCSSLAGRELGRLRAWHTEPAIKAAHDLASPCAVCDLPQHRLEPILVNAAQQRGAVVRFNTELMRFDQDGTGVTAVLADRLTGRESAIRACYMIGADGGNSRVAEQLGLPLEGRMGLGASLGILFTADLSRFVAHRPGVMYWMVQPGVGMGGYPIGVLRMVRPWDQWVGTWGAKLDETPAEMSDDTATAIVHRLIGDDSVEVRVEAVSTWSINGVHAIENRRGRVVCIGDAVHRHPPMNGLGSNTCVQDAYNLAWKLGMVLRGQAGEALLDTFGAERLPVGKAVVGRAMKSMGVLPPIMRALELSPPFPKPEMDAAIASLADDSPVGVARRTRLRAALDGTVQAFSALGAEHNIRYRSAAVVDDGSDATVEDPDLEPIHALETGRRLPHGWLAAKGRLVSTLDLCGHGRFALLTGLDGLRWREAAREAGRALAIAIDAHVIGPGQAHEDVYGDFARMTGGEEACALLVRPDQVVAWRAPASASVADPNRALLQVLTGILARG